MANITLLHRWLGQTARIAVKRERPFVIAITGAVGKSTTRQSCAAILEADGKGADMRVSQKNYNNELGVPLTVLDMASPGRSILAWLHLLIRSLSVRVGLVRTCPKIFVMEMGADHPGDIAYLTGLVPPDVAIITAVTPEATDVAPVHLENYSSIDALAEEKAALVKAVNKNGTVILNADDKRVFSMRHLTNAHVLTFGEADGSVVRIVGKRILTNTEEHGNMPVSLCVTFETYAHRETLTIPGVFGSPVAYALGAAIALGAAMDVHGSVDNELPNYFKPMRGRTRIIPGIKQTTLFDDTYNSSPAAVLSALRDLASVETKPGQRKIACLGEMRELGEDSKKLHRMVGAEAGRLGLDFLAVSGIFAHAMAEGALANGLSEGQIRVFDDTPEAGRFLQDYIHPGDIVLAKASQGTLMTTGVRMERVIKELMAEPLRAEELLVRQELAWTRK